MLYICIQFPLENHIREKSFLNKRWDLPSWLKLYQIIKW